MTSTTINGMNVRGHSRRWLTTAAVLFATFQLSACLQPLDLRADATQSPGTLSSWINSESRLALTYLIDNISPPGTAPGVVVASPSRVNPNYYYHWVRDSGLVMDTVVKLYQGATSTNERTHYFQMLSDYVSFSRGNQLTPNWSGGLGEPKFNVDGSAYNFSWGRPQNDSPGIRATALIHFANQLINEGQIAWVQTRLYNPNQAGGTVIKEDLEYVSQHWRESSFDLWEEVKGKHFYTKMVQRRSLIEGADLADRLGDIGARDWYRLQASQLENEIRKHWDDSRGYLVATLNPEAQRPFKPSGLDVAVVLGVLHGYASDGFYGPTSDQVLKSAAKIRAAFQNVYGINANLNVGTAIGRYPEDTYNGFTTAGEGNPWVLATNAFAELYYRAANEWEKQGAIPLTADNILVFTQLLGHTLPGLQANISLGSQQTQFTQILQAVRATGDSFLDRTRLHAFSNGRLSEEFNKSTGYMQGARDLTWSYASVLTALWAR